MPSKPKQFGRKRDTSRDGGSATLRDKSARYQRQRLTILDAQPLCRYCQARGHITPATILDHIVALALGGTNDPGNLAPCCKACNDAKAVDERAYLRRGHDLGSARYDPALAEWFKLAFQQCAKL